MKTQHISALFLALNIVLFILIAAKHTGQETFDKITVREFDLVGEDGKRRANIKVESSGEVVFRMMDKTGAIRVKLGADVDGSGLVLLNESTEPSIHALAKKDGGKLTLQTNEGKKRDL
jgi:hypothetical protein